jgi:uncharacterized protein YeaO (DUF488 family)
MHQIYCAFHGERCWWGIGIMQIWLKRAYQSPGGNDGTRVLVDRLWPRAVSRDKAAIDHWFKDIAPSDELRRWFGHESSRWGEFQRRYRAELDERQEALAPLCELVRQGRVTLIFGARDEKLNNAVVLKHYLEEKC